MYIVSANGFELIQVKIGKVKVGELRRFSKKKYFFNWREEEGQEVYKISLTNDAEVLGLISIERIAIEFRIHIRLLALSRENVGKNKKFNNVAGHLLVFVSKIAVEEYGVWACVSLRPKSILSNHYCKKYGMRKTGLTLSLEVPAILQLINNYEQHETK